MTVDMQRDYLDLPIATSPLAPSEVERVLGNTSRLLDTVRAAGIPIVHCYVKRRLAEQEHGFGGNAYSRAGQRHKLAQNVNAPVRTRYDRLEDSDAANLPDVLLGPGEIHMITEKTMDSFYGTDLEVLLLRALRPKTVVIVGINTDTCVYSTAFSAANRGYQVVLASDCTGSMRGADQHRMALELMSRSIGWVLTSDEIVDRSARPDRTGPSWPKSPPEGTDVPLTTDETTRVIAAAQQYAADNGWRITVAIVDEGGLLKALSRMDGAPPLSAQIAEAKACGAALWHREGDGLVDVAKSRPAFFEGVDRLVRLPILPALGSVLVRRDGVVLGAVGCSGATAEQDKECGQTGLAAVGL